jgi:hypothetical protein
MMRREAAVARLLTLSLISLFLLAVPSQAEEVVYRMSRETHDRWLKEGLSWWHFWGQPDQSQDPEDWLLSKITWGRLNSLKEAGITRVLEEGA